MSQMEDAELNAYAERLKSKGKLPRHIAIIMDGNGRWAEMRNLDRLAGHKAGRESVRATVRAARAIDVEALTLYTFSMENWNRPEEEVKGLMSFLEEVLREETDELDENNIRLVFMGETRFLPEATLEELRKTSDRLSRNDGMILNLALSYSSREEIVDACKKIAERILGGDLTPEEISEEVFSGALYRPELPDPDLLVRTSGEMRISNFLLWQTAYSEFYVTDVLWPDFRELDLYRAAEAYQKRDRRFGSLSTNSTPRVTS